MTRILRTTVWTVACFLFTLAPSHCQRGFWLTDFYGTLDTDASDQSDKAAFIGPRGRYLIALATVNGAENTCGVRLTDQRSGKALVVSRISPGTPVTREFMTDILNIGVDRIVSNRAILSVRRDSPFDEDFIHEEFREKLDQGDSRTIGAGQHDVPECSVKLYTVNGGAQTCGLEVIESNGRAHHISNLRPGLSLIRTYSSGTFRFTAAKIVSNSVILAVNRRIPVHRSKSVNSEPGSGNTPRPLPSKAQFAGLKVKFTGVTASPPGGLCVLSAATGKQVRKGLEAQLSAQVCALRLYETCGGNEGAQNRYL